MTDNKDKNNMVSAQPPVLTEEQLQMARGARGYVPTEAPVENKPASAAVNADVAQPKYGSFGDIIGALEQDAARYKAETDAQKKAREKREKWQGVIGGIADMGSALANLFFTAGGAPNMYNHAQGMSERNRVRWEKAKAEREANREKYLDRLYKLAQIKDAEDGKLRVLERQRKADEETKEQREWERDKWEREIAIKEAKANKDAVLADLRVQYMQGKIDGVEYANAIKAVELQHAQSYYRNRASGAGKKGSGGGGNGRPGEFPWYDQDGNVHYAHSKAAAEANARVAGTLIEDEHSSTRKSDVFKIDHKGNTKKTGETTSTTTRAKNRPMTKEEVEKAYPKKKGKSAASKNYAGTLD